MENYREYILQIGVHFIQDVTEDNITTCKEPEFALHFEAIGDAMDTASVINETFNSPVVKVIPIWEKL